MLLGATSVGVAQESIEVSCSGAPSEAVRVLPEPLSRWAKIRCTIFGHTLTANDQWLWSAPGALAPTHFPAQMVRKDPQQLGHQAYFRAIEFVKIEGTEASDANQKISGALGAKPEPLESAYRLTLTNNQGNQHIVYFVRTEHEAKTGQGLWGFACNSGCKQGTPFMLLNYEGKR